MKQIVSIFNDETTAEIRGQGGGWHPLPVGRSADDLVDEIHLN